MSTVREASRLFEWAQSILLTPFRFISSTQRPSESSSSHLLPAAEAGEPSFAAQEHLLTDGRLEEAVSLALLAAFPELGVWRARFDHDRRQPDQARLTLSLSLGRSTLVHAARHFAPSDLSLVNWVQSLREMLASCVDEICAQLEGELDLNPEGGVARALTRQVQVNSTVLEPKAIIAHYRRRLAREGPSLLKGLDPSRGAVNLLAEVEADARAELLLARQLGPAYAAVRRHGYLDVPSRLFPRRVYRVRRAQRIQVLDNGRCTAELCMESGIKVPEADEFLMKTVWLRGNEEQVLRTANHFPAARLLL